MKHTKGSWRYAAEKHCVPNAKTLGYGIFSGSNFIAFTKEEANAKLIATAPELLEVCKKAEIEVNKWHSMNVVDNDIPNEKNAWKCLKELQQAIAKAEGK